MTVQEQIKVARQELSRRKNQYPRFIEAGKLTQLEANYQIEVMEQIICTLETVREFQLGITTTDRKKL